MRNYFEDLEIGAISRQIFEQIIDMIEDVKSDVCLQLQAYGCQLLQSQGLQNDFSNAHSDYGTITFLYQNALFERCWPLWPFQWPLKLVDSRRTEPKLRDASRT